MGLPRLESVTLLILLNNTLMISVLFLSGTTLASRPIAALRDSEDSEMAMKAVQVQRSSSMVPSHEEFTGKEQKPPSRTGGLSSWRKSGSTGNSRFKSEEDIELRIPLGEERDLKLREGRIRTPGYLHREPMTISKPSGSLEGSRRAMLRDISPPGMWPVSADQDDELSLRRRALLEASGTGDATRD